MSNEDDKRRGMRARKVAPKLATVTDVEKQQVRFDVTCPLAATPCQSTSRQRAACASIAAAQASIDARAGVQAVTARLNALENDNTAAEEVAAASDDEFDVDEESEEERSSDEEDMRLGCANGHALLPTCNSGSTVREQTTLPAFREAA